MLSSPERGRRSEHASLYAHRPGGGPLSRRSHIARPVPHPHLDRPIAMENVCTRSVLLSCRDEAFMNYNRVGETNARKIIQIEETDIARPRIARAIFEDGEAAMAASSKLASRRTFPTAASCGPVLS